MISKRAPSPCASTAGSGFSPKPVKKLLRPEKASSTPEKPAATIMAPATPLRAPMPPKSNAFSTCSRSRCQYGTPEACWHA